MPSDPTTRDIDATVREKCRLCGSLGEGIYAGLRDHLFGISGQWGFKRCLNPTCGLIWLDPMPPPSEIAKLYTGYFTHNNRAGDGPLPSRLSQIVGKFRDGVLSASMGYKEADIGYAYHFVGKALSKIGILRERIAGSVMWLEASRRGRVLDVGCGSGSFLSGMRRLGWETVGVEMDAEAAELARQRFDLEVHTGTVEQAPLPAGSFDAITLNHVIEHLYDPVATLAECNRLLKPGGLLVATTPNSAGWGHRHFGENWRGLEPPRHLHLFNPQSMKLAAVKAGLVVKQLRSVGRAAAYILAMSDALRLMRRRSEDRGDHDRLMGIIRRRFIRCILYQLWECVYLSGRPMGGEEVLLIAERP